MSRDTISIPVEATMRRMPDGSFTMEQAIYIETDPDFVARWLIDKFHIPLNRGIDNPNSLKYGQRFAPTAFIGRAETKN